MQYKIVEEKEDLKDAVIEKTGHVVKFTMREVERDIEINKKQKENIEAKLGVEKAKMENIEHFHPFVKEMSEEDLNTCYMYFEAKSLVKIATEKIAEFDENQKELDEELQDIYKQIPQLGTKAYDFTEETN